jgi:hypothetical protein
MKTWRASCALAQIYEDALEYLHLAKETEMLLRMKKIKKYSSAILRWVYGMT